MFRARLPSIFITSHKMPHPRNLHPVATWCSLANAICKNTQMTMGTSKVLRLAAETATHLLKTSQKYCACHTKRLSTRYKTRRLNVTKCHACHAKRSNATFETSKNDPFWRTYHRHGHIAIARTVADGCERLRTVADVNATSSEHTPSAPRPPEWNGNPWYAFGKTSTYACSVHPQDLAVLAATLLAVTNCEASCRLPTGDGRIKLRTLQYKVSH